MTMLNASCFLTEKFCGSDVIALHPERCLNTRFRALDCSLCGDACPAKGAITVTNGKPALAHNACLHCGLCLHDCPTTAFTSSDGLPTMLLKTATRLPAAPVDLLCPHHPTPAFGPAPQAVLTKRCLAALSPAILLELSTLGKKIWLDDTYCADCVLGQIHPFIKQTVAQANAWRNLLKNSGFIQLRAEVNEPIPAAQRPVYDASRPPISRRDLFASFKQIRPEMTAPEAQVDMVKTAKSTPVSERLPHSIPPQRAKIVSILKRFSPSPSPISNPQSPSLTRLGPNTPSPSPAHLSTNNQLPITNNQSPISNLPISNLHIDPARCTACSLCARFCPSSALKFSSDGTSFALTFQPLLCLGPACNICVLACPEQAVSSPSTMESPNLLTKKTLVAAELRPCQRCKQPLAQGPDLPKTCFACRPKTMTSSLSRSKF